MPSPPAASGAVSHLQHRPQYQLHERLFGGLRFFCAFYRKPKSPEGYVLDREVLMTKIQETIDLGGDQILMQGGMNPDLPIEWYEELLREIGALSPSQHPRLQSARDSRVDEGRQASVRTVLERLKAAGLGSLPGGGAEILVDRVRKEMTRGKVLSDDWLNVCRVWHQMGGAARPR